MRHDIQQNLNDALQHLGLLVRAVACLFWVDALCISQADDEERSIQVGVMKNIYASSAGIFAWLGVPTDEEGARLAVQYMRNFDTYLNEDSAEDASYVLSTITKDHPAFPHEQESEAWRAWHGIADICLQPYWERTWVHQEATTPSPILFFWGTYIFDDIQLNAALGIGVAFTRFEEFPRRLAAAVGIGGIVTRLILAREQRQKRGEGGGRPLELIRELQATACSDPRDKVFAALGHARDLPLRLTSVDYSRSVVDIYKDVALYAFFDANLLSLEALGLVNTYPENGSYAGKPDPRVHNLPSWVPHWSNRYATTGFVDSSMATLNRLPLYEPWLQSKADVRVCGNELELTGIVARSLDLVTMTNVWDGVDRTLTIPKVWYIALMSQNEQESDWQTKRTLANDLEEAICRSLVGDRSQTEIKSQSGESSYVCQRGGTLRRALLHSSAEPVDEMQDISVGDVVRLCYRRRMARLTTGNIAVLPGATKVGDKIAAFCGGHCLYLLRPISGREAAYTFIGDCYVDGLMDGNLVDICKR